MKYDKGGKDKDMEIRRTKTKEKKHFSIHTNNNIY
jgi:hypothetical protein